MSTVYGQPDVYIPFQISSADTIANNAQEFVSPVDGFIRSLRTTVQAANTAAGTITMKTGTALAVTVPGISNVVPAAAAKGDRQSSVSTRGATGRAIAKGDRISLQLAGFATAGAVNGIIHIEATDNSPEPGYTA